MSDAIEQAIQREDWDTARALIESALLGAPDDHWLLTRLSLTYYEQRDYERALQLSERALASDPDCPLVLWDYAGTLHMLDRPEEALAAYGRITRRGMDKLAHGPCGEGRAWARGLFADCLYRMALCHEQRGETDQAAALLRRHVQLRGPGCQSIYPLADVRRKARNLGL